MFDLEPWMMAAMEEEGIMDTNTGLLNRVAKKLAAGSNDIIGNDELIQACYASNVDPGSLTEDDLKYLNEKLSKL